ncbi:disease resistance protein RGA5-like [Triticum aestivum]|uniref:disease resistance protein RGA5-like n=1 Tax=Triticum aestivum TaxID=4565 RepID=UPI001D00E93A|nr:disease resistance protein RGA5-like [Triticum aestivum]
MAGGIVTVASAVMNPLISKLNALMGVEYDKFKGVRKQASFLERELSAMNAALQKLELMDDELDPTIKDWVDHVRDMSYDMENCIDDFMHDFRADDAKGGLIEKTAQFIKKFRQRLRTVDRMEELKDLALEANSRRERYKIDEWKPVSGSVAVDPRLRAVYQEAATLMGIDGPREKVATLLMDTQKKLKVVSIVGFGGLGKTTLAKQVYDKTGSQFDIKAFFSVSQRPDIAELLNNFQLKLGMDDPVSSRARKVNDIIEELRQHLKDKRYLIVVDDVWDESTWKTILCAFPEDCNGSRVIVTTRVEGVARAACHNDRESIYKLEPLSEENSRRLLLNRDFEILTGDLVRQWIAEGFISSLHAQDLEDIGRSYLNELINRNMIQPSETECREECCKVHDMMLDLILSKCAEDNFVSVAYNYQEMARLNGCKYKARRLSLRSTVGGGATNGPTIGVALSQVRSFTLLGNSMPPLSSFKYLRVFRGDGETLDLTAISQLFQLRYLYVRGQDFVQLPAKLQALVYLETLAIIDADIKSIPSDIVHLPRLSFLQICMEEVLPEWIGDMTSLHTLILSRYSFTDKVGVNVMKGFIGLGKLTNLRKVEFQVECMNKLELEALACSIGKLCNLKYFTLYGPGTEVNNQMDSLSIRFQHMEEFHGTLWRFRRVPKWMSGLHCLRILDLRVEEISTEEVHLLGRLPSLMKLDLRPSHIPKERAILGTGLFPVLEYFLFESREDVMSYLGFEAGAMPNIQTLTLHVAKWCGGVPIGMEHLLRRQKIELPQRSSGDSIISSTLRHALSVHPNHPSVE